MGHRGRCSSPRPVFRMSAETGSSLGTRGFERSFKPASCGRRSAFFWFTSLADQTRFGSAFAKGYCGQGGVCSLLMADVRLKTCATTVSFVNNPGARLCPKDQPQPWRFAVVDLSRALRLVLWTQPRSVKRFLPGGARRVLLREIALVFETRSVQGSSGSQDATTTTQKNCEQIANSKV